MKSYFLSDFLNPERKSETLKQQLRIVANSADPERRVIRRGRDPEETKLLLRSIRDRIAILESKGVLNRNGRTWTFFVES